MPNTVRSIWKLWNGLSANPCAKIILPSVDAAEQEVPRQIQAGWLPNGEPHLPCILYDCLC
jgi:hypothetical protein